MYNDGCAFLICDNLSGKESRCSCLRVWLIVCMDISANVIYSELLQRRDLTKKEWRSVCCATLYYNVGNFAPGMDQNQI
jgi:hypothetical protein